MIPFFWNFGTIISNLIVLYKSLKLPNSNGGNKMEDTNVVELYEWLDEATTVIQQQMDEPYLEGLTIALEALFYNDAPEGLNDIVSKKLTEALEEIDLETKSTLTIRKAIQLAVLKGMKDATQYNHMITPETISMFIGYLAEKLTEKQDTVRVFDPVSGTANLLLIVLDHLKKDTAAYASEIDATLLQLALLNANLQKKRVEYFHQDSLRPFLLDPVDLVVADLPVGYYPDDAHAAGFELNADEGHAFAHHLLIEQSLHYTKEGGYLIFVIPEFLFQSEQADKLHAFIQKHAHIIGLLQLPDTAFQSEDHKKSIFILRKKGEDTKDVQQPLLAMLPSFKDTGAMENVLVKINQWFEQTDLA